MVKFTVKCAFVATLFFFGVLVGMQKAEQGMQDMKHGGAAAQLEQPAHKQANPPSFQDQKAALEHVKSFNIFSAAGTATSDALTGIFQVGVNAASSLVVKWLDG